ncbi:MAG: alpha/beta fold hydrolase [Actinomycetota bacterium]|nr:alpha/beta hydrolase [Actinomycetota bacterium]
MRAPVSTVGSAIHAAIRDSKLVVIPGVGHMVNLEAPAEFDAEARAFLGALG